LNRTVEPSRFDPDIQLKKLLEISSRSMKNNRFTLNVIKASRFYGRLFSLPALRRRVPGRLNYKISHSWLLAYTLFADAIITSHELIEKYKS